MRKYLCAALIALGVCGVRCDALSTVRVERTIGYIGNESSVLELNTDPVEFQTGEKACQEIVCTPVPYEEGAGSIENNKVLIDDAEATVERLFKNDDYGVTIRQIGPLACAPIAWATAPAGSLAVDTPKGLDDVCLVGGKSSILYLQIDEATEKTGTAYNAHFCDDGCKLRLWGTYPGELYGRLVATCRVKGDRTPSKRSYFCRIFRLRETEPQKFAVINPLFTWIGVWKDFNEFEDHTQLELPDGGQYILPRKVTGPETSEMVNPLIAPYKLKTKSAIQDHSGDSKGYAVAPYNFKTKKASTSCQIGMSIGNNFFKSARGE